MAQVHCRCGEALSVPPGGPDRIVCTKCGAKIRVRRPKRVGDVDGFIRFSCPCGRRLKVLAANSPEAGKCPDCGRVVPVPASSVAAPVVAGDPEAVTEELSTDELARLEKWARERAAQVAGAPAQAARPASPAPPIAPKAEAGLRVCPRCGRPVHLGASTCRECGVPVPRR